MNWDIEERVEDAFVAYLKGKVGGKAQVVPALSARLQFPCVSVLAAETDTVVPGTAWNLPRKLDVKIAVITEMADETDAGGIILTTARERNSVVRSAVMDALMVLDSATAPAGLTGLAKPEDLPTGLAAELCVQGIAGIWIKLAQPKSPLTVRSVDEEHRAMLTTISILVIAQPVEL
ncbi:MAG: hypothetical protein ABFD59_08310 [Smithella sp.]